MTGYYIEIGYLSGYSGPADLDQAWDSLKNVVAILREQPANIVGEAMRVEGGSLRKLLPFAERYHPKFTDGTIEVNDAERQITQLASSGNGDAARVVKEQVRRAFCRLVIQEMHRRGIEVNLCVA